jgi:hypothetical protein
LPASPLSIIAAAVKYMTVRLSGALASSGSRYHDARRACPSRAQSRAVKKRFLPSSASFSMAPSGDTIPPFASALTGPAAAAAKRRSAGALPSSSVIRAARRKGPTSCADCTRMRLWPTGSESRTVTLSSSSWKILSSAATCLPFSQTRTALVVVRRRSTCRPRPAEMNVSAYATTASTGHIASPRGSAPSSFDAASGRAWTGKRMPV